MPTLAAAKDFDEVLLETAVKHYYYNEPNMFTIFRAHTSYCHFQCNSHPYYLINDNVMADFFNSGKYTN